LNKQQISERHDMFQGELVGIFIGPKKREPLQAIAQVEAVAGRGLVGDRYFLQDGTFSKKDSPDREVTLVEIESIEAMNRESGIALDAAQVRRNLCTRGVPLNHLVDRDFTVGEVVLHGIRLCEPCSHLESLTCKGVQDGLHHRGGLRARVVKGGILRSGDKIHEQS
jgi:MOSC domain-containing protein YiiM